ncbi:MAG: hypothetical protein WDN67_04990 [Candidatus Moraniibacteriota bacterium]
MLVARVIGRATRSGGEWLYLDAGVYNAMFEAMACQGSTRYRIEPLRLRKSSEEAIPFVVAGPTGDGLDVITKHACLPGSISTGGPAHHTGRRRVHVSSGHEIQWLCQA